MTRSEVQVPHRPPFNEATLGWFFKWSVLWLEYSTLEVGGENCLWKFGRQSSLENLFSKMKLWGRQRWPSPSSPTIKLSLRIVAFTSDFFLLNLEVAWSGNLDLQPKVFHWLCQMGFASFNFLTHKVGRFPRITTQTQCHFWHNIAHS